jgi:hypothetical protein
VGHCILLDKKLSLFIIQDGNLVLFGKFSLGWDIYLGDLNYERLIFVEGKFFLGVAKFLGFGLNIEQQWV